MQQRETPIITRTKVIEIAMRIIDIQEKAVSISSTIRNAYIDFSTMNVSVVALTTDVVRDGKPVVGYGFNSNGRYAQSALIRDRFAPRILNASADELVSSKDNNLDPFAIWHAMMQNEKPGGHGERSVAVGVIDMAVWDAVAKIAEVPLYQLLAERYGPGEPDLSVWVYAAGGYYYPDKDIPSLQDEMRRYLDLGYTTVKLKIGGDDLVTDMKRIEAVVDIVGNGSCVCVDANGRFDLQTAIEYADALAPLDLRWYEEAGDPLDYALQSELAQHYDGALATGENLFSVQDARNLIRYAGMRADRDILQFDCALSYGLVEYLRILEMLHAHGWSSRRIVPHGGHQLSLNIAAGLQLGGNESYPEVFQPFGGFADDLLVEDGYVALPKIPGIGFEAKNELYTVMKEFQ
jgi:L-alanine-DL-glutamate epimerase-like enolase superfamily enzyme